MKKIVFALLVFPLFTNAQQLSLGPEIGTNVVMLEKTDLGRNYHLCWLGGANAEYKFYDMFSLRSGVYLSHRKTMYESADTSQLTVLGFEPSDLGIPGVDFSIYSKTKGVVSQLGIEVPLFAAFNIREFSVFAGPYMHFMIGAWSKETEQTRIPFLEAINIDSIDQSGILSSLFPPATSEKFIESSSKENLKIFDYGFKTGISYTAERFRLNACYTFGIPDYRIDRGSVEVNTHNYFSMSIAYNFNIGKRKGNSSFGD